MDKLSEDEKIQRKKQPFQKCLLFGVRKKSDKEEKDCLVSGNLVRIWKKKKKKGQQCQRQLRSRHP
jgi:hypothetical protein